ncbi:AER269Cp [Eremothecium gossypii ATCC 10895]|uniref:AER269Cp n=1 Tax=Eremothecium gossypii (strain ATCC 10895 / CBS 109.51 / FGSC 9923 / NRRL Y-1056) TaxID=284811 RepID=Q756J2_EREGS|nr:AER269Cp [Eremothecium gossypii ATCC 10895]AAS52950.2 AER269Cp [Eremothecium gossypii ATCC 10895]AEY97257.1 FAER269Cp [Eremothecium gossypii FDAG1]
MRKRQLLGYLYATCWSVSMYPPLWINWKRQSARALSKGYVVFNCIGYTALVLSLVVQTVLWQNEGDTSSAVRPSVGWSDYWYAMHSWLLNGLLASQVLWGTRLWGFTGEPANRMSTAHRKMMQLFIGLFCIGTVQYVVSITQTGLNNQSTLFYCHVLYFIKIIMSVLKYIAQAKHNYERKSTVGFSMLSVSLDICGGVFSLAQLVLDLTEKSGISVTTVKANSGKLGIGLVSLLFNFVYISQWLLYR